MAFHTGGSVTLRMVSCMWWDLKMDHIAGHDDCLRRFTYLYSWRFRRYRIWYRHIGSGDGAFFAMHHATQAKEDAH